MMDQSVAASLPGASILLADVGDDGRVHIINVEHSELPHNYISSGLFSKDARAALSNTSFTPALSLALA
jgi:hypothetical protein